MALDVPAVPIASQTIRYVRAAWDFNRDGGAVGRIYIPTQAIPAGTLCIGTAFQVVEAVTAESGAEVVVMLGDHFVDRLSDPVGVRSSSHFGLDDSEGMTDSAWGISLDIQTAALLGGSMFIYVFYV
jgi:hypothetical protein